MVKIQTSDLYVVVVTPPPPTRTKRTAELNTLEANFPRAASQDRVGGIKVGEVVLLGSWRMVALCAVIYVKGVSGERGGAEPLTVAFAFFSSPKKFALTVTHRFCATL